MRKNVFSFNNIKTLIQGRTPGQLIIQFTDSCNATCPQCGMRKTSDFKRSKIDIDEIKRIIDAAKRKNIQALSFTGGETFIYKDELLSIIRYASDRGIPFIRTGTNGFFMTDFESPYFYDKINYLAEELSESNLRNLWFSIDSADEATHEKMRGLPGVIKGMRKALPIFHSHGIYPAANLGINRNTGGEGNIPLTMTDKEEFYRSFREVFSKFYEFIIDLGFTMTNVCYPMNMEKNEENDINPVYGATSTSNIVSFSRNEKIEIFKALKDTIPEYRDKIRIFTP